MKARHLILALLLIAATAATSMHALFASPKPGVSLRNFAYIHRGMTLEEVQAVMGRPPDHSRDDLRSALRVSSLNAVEYCWICDNGQVVVTVILGAARRGYFARGGSVVAMLPEPPESFQSRLARWIGFGKGSF